MQLLPNLLGRDRMSPAVLRFPKELRGVDSRKHRIRVIGLEGSQGIEVLERKALVEPFLAELLRHVGPGSETLLPAGEPPGLGIGVFALRFFTVYGPRQRPDMGYWKFIDALLRNEPIVVYGDGQQNRGNTYIDDCVAATVAALESPIGETYNLGGGGSASVWDILHKLERIVGRKAITRPEPGRPGDQRSTFADTSKLQRHLGWQARTPLDEGLARQVDWQRNMIQRAAA